MWCLLPPVCLMCREGKKMQNYLYLPKFKSVGSTSMLITTLLGLALLLAPVNAQSATSAGKLPSLAGLAEKLSPSVVNISTETKIETSSRGFKDQKKRKAKIVGRDPQTDIALLQVETKPGDTFTAVKLGDSEKLRVGDWVMAIGNPFGLSHTVTAGIVSAKGRVIGSSRFDNFIQTDASINPGNSGGPLFDLNGNVVGINTAIFSRSGGNIGIGFAIPINMAKKLLPQLRTGVVTRGFLGVSIQPVNESLAKVLDLKETRGALVANVIENAPAEKAGIKRGDLIVSINEKKIENPRQLSLTAADLKPGSIAKVGIIRDGKKRVVKLQVAKLPVSSEERAKASKPALQKQLGIDGQNLTPELRKQIGAKAEKGVVISNVLPDSPAAIAGLRRGDVIVEANRKAIANMDQLREALKKGENKGNLLVIERRGTTRYVVLEGKG